MFRYLIFALSSLVAATSAQADGTRQQGQPVFTSEAGKQFAYQGWHFAPAFKHGNQLFVSGVATGPVDGDMKAGFVRMWEELDARIKAGGGNGLDDVVAFTSFHVGLQAQLKDFAEVKDRYIKEPYPAWTAIGIAELAFPSLTTEVRVTVVLPEAKQ